MYQEKRISDIAHLWKADKRKYIKKSSFSAYAILISNHILPSFGNLYTVTESDVQEFVLQKLNDGLSQKSTKDILIVLKMILKFGAKNKWVDFWQFDVQFPTVCEKSNIEVLSKSEQKMIMNHIKDNFTFRNLGIFICLSAGMRIGEICALSWENIDIDKGIIKVRKTIQRIYVMEENINRTELVFDVPKTQNSIRDIPISKDLLRILKPLKKITNNSFYVLTNDVKPTEPRTYRSYYKKLMKELGLPDLKFHGLRHSFATRCIESKCDYKTVSVLLGHSNVSTTLNLYVHPNLEQKKKCIDQMSRAL